MNYFKEGKKLLLFRVSGRQVITSGEGSFTRDLGIADG
jgi:hypothetical protein